ncbi:hypothetical protein B0H21DRAFT_710191 [Amylocystis lapponica]|nr:hypothetical protein B0H21DRAFT_710191 [Amylocystis lapponica]
MADTHHKPLEGKVPKLYKANPTQTKEFLCQCDNCLDLNSGHFNNNKERIIWTLTYFDKETPTARRWATAFETKAQSGGNWGTWIDFKKKLFSYDTAVEAEEAHTLIEYLHQKKGQTAAQWRDKFLIVLEATGYKEDLYLGTLVQCLINPAIVWK